MTATQQKETPARGGDAAGAVDRQADDLVKHSTGAAPSNLGALAEAIVLWVPRLRVAGDDPIYATSLRSALTQRFEAYPDACIVPYVCDPPRRLRIHDASDPTLKLAWLPVDLDGPRKPFKGKPGGVPEAVQAEHDMWVSRTLELAGELPTPPMAWLTPNGIRLLWALVPGSITSADYTPRCSALLDQLEAHGISGVDRACTDWTRLQRLPHGSELLVPEGGVAQIMLPPASASSSPPLGAVSGPVTESTLFRMFEAADPDAVGTVSGDIAHVRCPWDDEHSNAGSPIDSSTAILADRQGKGMGVFVCKHAHCAHRGNADVLALLKLDAAATRILAEHDAGRQAAAASLLQTPANDNARGAETSVRGADPGAQRADWLLRLQVKDSGAIIPSAHNLDATFEWHPAWRGVFGFDLLANDVVVLREPPVEGLPSVGKRWTADETHSLNVWLNREMRIQPRDAHIIAAVKNVARRAHSFHPVRDYLRSVSWDGKRRSLCTYLGVELTRYSVAACSAWLRSAVARVMQPGCKADLLLILEGPQGARKSSALRALAGDEWFYEASGGAKDKDFAQDMRGKWIAEIPEIDRMLSGRDDSELKAIVSKQVDRYRPSYGRDSHDFPRQVVFGGTTNRDGYLKDGTGNRRYCPLRCGSIDLEGIMRDRDQLWAQVVAEYDAGKRWWLPNNIERRAAVKEQAERLEQDVWEDLIREWVEAQTKPFSTADALGNLPGAKPAATLERRDEMRMAAVLRALGFVSKQTGGKRVMRWHATAEACQAGGETSRERGETD
jgi:predicted P-loop ATPase